MLIVQSLLVVFFFFASSVKMFGWVKVIFNTQLVFFKKYGLNRSAMFAVGVLEATGATTVLLGIMMNALMLSSLGAGLLAMISVGAMLFHFRFDTWKDAIPSIVTLLLSAVVALPLLDLL